MLAKDAHLIFASYNYVLDSRIRSGLKLTELLRGAVVIIDEAHNVEETARDRVGRPRQRGAARGAHAARRPRRHRAPSAACCHDMGNDSFSPRSTVLFVDTGGEDHYAAADKIELLANLVRALDTLCSENCSAVVARWSRGSDSQGAAADAIPGGSDDPAYAAPATFEVAANWVPGGGAAGGVAQAWGAGGGAHTPPKLAVSELLGTLGVGDESYQQWEVGMKAAEIVVGHLSADAAGGPTPLCCRARRTTSSSSRWRCSATASTSSTPTRRRTTWCSSSAPASAPSPRRARFEYELGLWLLDASVVLKPLSKLCHSLVFASGTLEPLEQVAAECGLNVTASTKLAVKEHVVPREQMWLGAVWRDSAQGRVIKAVKKLPDGVPHNIGCPGEYNYRATCTCDWRQHQFFLDSLGDVLMQLIHATPAGVLVFFPSYAMLRSAQARWQRTWGDRARGTQAGLLRSRRAKAARLAGRIHGVG